MLIFGKLMISVQHRISCGIKMALFIIEDIEGNTIPNTLEGRMAASYVSLCQQSLLTFMQLNHVPIWKIRFQSGIPSAADETVNQRSYGAQKTLTIFHPNAFLNTNLDEELKQLNISQIVVIGKNDNTVMHMTIGSKWIQADTGRNGATHLGYTVLTCSEVIDGKTPSWKDSTEAHYQRLEFYKMF